MTAATAPQKLVEIRDLKVHFPIHRGLLRRQTGAVRAVDGISLDIFRGETLGLVGESGCGKSTTGLAMLRLLDITAGEIRFDGRDVASLSQQELRAARRNMQMVFQDPYSSLNPRMTIGSIIVEPLNVHRVGTPAERRERVYELMRLVGLNPSFINRYPHEFSGGQRQRVGLARDVSIQAQVVNLMADLKERLGLTYVMVSHDLSMVRYISDRVAVMYLGRIVEIGERDRVFDAPAHPYTQALLSAIPSPDPKRERERRRIVLQGDVPNPANPPSGCHFHPRCPKATPLCKETDPPLRSLAADTGQTGAAHGVACHHA